ncbi:hemerythrin domain-containing protein [Paludifilum halophilum]|nr:hemerythrin domain-containing protein [Paludifilum halophilum]
MAIQSCQQLQEFDDTRFVKKTLHKGYGNVVFLLHLLPGQELPAHTHSGKEVFLLGLQGRGSLWIGGDHYPVGCQDFIYCSDEDELRVYNDGTEGWSLYVVLSAKKEPENQQQVKEPIKRPPSLFPLSRHHHHALVMSRQLKHQKEEWTVLRKNLKKFWNQGGQQHFREEEEILLPTYSRYASVERPEILEMLMEHVRIRGQVEQILQGAGVPSKEILYNLGNLLESHVRKEERVVFPMMENEIPEREWHRLGELLSHE